MNRSDFSSDQHYIDYLEKKIDRISTNRWIGIMTREAFEVKLEESDLTNKALVYWDVDGLKKCNDEYGKVASSMRMRTTVERQADLIGMVFSGDEQLAVIDANDALEFAERIQSRYKENGLDATFVVRYRWADVWQAVSDMDELCNALKKNGLRGTIIEV